MNVRNFLLKKVLQAMIKLKIPFNKKDHKIEVRKSNKPHFGHYQVNGIILISRKLNIPSKFLAEKIINSINLKGVAKKIEVSDPGFINIFLDPFWLGNQLKNIMSSPRLGVSLVTPKNIIVDYSSPNLAKEMHVGHMRSTIIGDSMVKILKFLGHNVIKVNHVGDWGIQFGMLIAYLKEIQNNNIEKISLSKLEDFYRSAKHLYDTDENFFKKSRNFMFKLQNGDEHCFSLWKKIVNSTIKQNQKIYRYLNVSLTEEDITGESAYRFDLPIIVKDLKDKKLAVENQGAVVVFLKEFKNKTGEPMGVVIQKNDGTYLYSTIDIACIKYRCKVLKANRIIYYTDLRQSQHLLQTWIISRKAGYVSNDVLLEHHAFGMILNKNKKPFKTRDGGTIKISSLLKLVLKKAYLIISSKNSKLTNKELRKLTKIIGIGSLKYSDLLKNRATNYIFDLEKMLSFSGNSAPYIQYAYCRINSIIENYKVKDQKSINNFYLKTENEIKIAVHLLQLEETIFSIAEHGTPNLLCSYLYELTVLFSSFYEKHQILNLEDNFLKKSRIQLSLLVSRTIKQGLNLLGIDITEKM